MKRTWLNSGAGKLNLSARPAMRHRQAGEFNFNTKSHMTRLVLSLLAIVAIQSICYAEVTKLPADDQQVLRDAARFHEIKSATKLPHVIFEHCADGRGRLGDPGQKWEATDCISDDKLPTKRMIWAYTNGEYYVVHYECGGVAHSFHVLVAKLKAGDSKPSFVWYGAERKSIKDYAAFLEALESRKGLDDRREYYH